jgi:hypothetical protein
LIKKRPKFLEKYNWTKKMNLLQSFTEEEKSKVELSEKDKAFIERTTLKYQDGQMDENNYNTSVNAIYSKYIKKEEKKYVSSNNLKNQPNFKIEKVNKGEKEVVIIDLKKQLRESEETKKKLESELKILQEKLEEKKKEKQEKEHKSSSSDLNHVLVKDGGQWYYR